MPGAPEVGEQVGLDELVSQATGVPCYVADEPLLCVAKGTGIALENLDIFDEEDLVGHVARNQDAFRQTLEKLKDLPIVGDVRGIGYFWAIELVKDKNTKETFNDAESEKLLRGILSQRMFEEGLYCRSDDRGDPVVQLAPPLTIGPDEFNEIEQILRGCLIEAQRAL